MTTDLDDPVIIATLTTADGEPDGPLLTGGCHRLCKAAVTGAGLPAFLLTAAETLSIRHPVIPRIRPGGGCRDGDPVMITVTIWHNVARDHEGRHTGMLDGHQPGDPMVRVFTYQATAGCRSPQERADDAYEAFNADPEMLAGGQREVAARYRDRQLRSLSFPGNSPCCGRSCCVHSRAVWPRSSSRPSAERTSCERQPDTGRSHR
jgi:hypothetical protein